MPFFVSGVVSRGFVPLRSAFGPFVPVHPPLVIQRNDIQDYVLDVSNNGIVTDISYFTPSSSNLEEDAMNKE